MRGYSGTELAGLAGVSSSKISAYENKRSTPSPQTLDVLANTLRVPPSFLLLQGRSNERGTVFNRSMSAATKRAKMRSDSRLQWLRDITAYLSDYVGFPLTNLPDLRINKDPLRLADDEVEAAADSARRFWNVRPGPISNMVLLLESQGVIVGRDSLGSPYMESNSEFPPDDDRPYVIIGTDKGTPARWRFDAAHELGHLLLHRHVDQTTFATPELHKQLERQAHRFAGAFLLPASDFGDDLYAANLEAFRSLKTRWGVSIALMVKRSTELGYVSEESARRLQISLSKRKWRIVEPGDDSMETEEPRLLRRAFEMILDEGIQTPGDILAALRMDALDVEALAGLAPGFLGEHSPVSLLSPFAREPEEAGDEGRAPGVVLQLPFGRRVT